MRVRVQFGTLTKVIGVVALWLCAASAAEAAPGPRYANVGGLCTTQPAALKKLLRHPKSYGGPVATRQRASRLGLRFDLTPHARRAKRAPSTYDPAAIQNDTPARVDINDGPRPALTPIGFLIRPVDSRPWTRAFSPRSPRGPPAAA